MKYIIEIEEKPLCVFDKDTQTYFPRLWRVKGFNSLVFDEEGLSRLEELNSDYINEHFGDLQDTAYQRGLDDAWEAARKIAVMWEKMDNDDFLETFGVTAKIGESTIGALFKKQTANEAMLELEAYEEKQKADDEIKVGDEVYCKGDDTSDSGVVTWVGKKSIYAMWQDGSAGEVQKDEFIKTGRHFDIASILKEMQP